MDALEEVLVELWLESQGTNITIKDAGIIQDCVIRVANAIGIDAFD